MHARFSAMFIGAKAKCPPPRHYLATL